MFDEEEEFENDGLEDEEDLENEGLDSSDMDIDDSSEQGDSSIQGSEISSEELPVSRSLGLLQRIVQGFRKLPSALKGGALATFFNVLIVIFLCLIALFAVAWATGAAEELWDDLTGGEGGFWEKAGNFFTGNGWVSDETKAENAENAYFKKLESVYREFQEKYHVSIDTTLITATLFYERDMGSYYEEEEIDEDEDVDSDTEENIYDDTAKFYKLAKRHIKTLAKYQLVENTTYNACTEQAQRAVKPSSAKKIAENWTTVRYGYNTRSTFNYITREDKTYTKADGTTGTVRWCPYEEVHTQLDAPYNEDKVFVAKKRQEYDTCVENAKARCISGCPSSTNSLGVTVKDRSCVSSCNSANYDAECSVEKEAWEKANNIYEANWLENGLYDDHGFKTCVETSKWGYADPYSDVRSFWNYSFDLDLINKAEEPGFLDEIKMYWEKGERKINCSEKPSIQYTYAIDVSREGVYYHKLLARNTKFLSDKNFIERYYPEHVDLTDPDASYKFSVDIVEGIFDVYEYVSEREGVGFAYGGATGSFGFGLGSNDNICSGGITVIPGTNNSGYRANPSQYPIGTFDLDEYVAMVLNGENNSGYDESMKAQIIAARTYALVKTDGCTKPIRNSTQDQVARGNPSQHLLDLAAQTSGIVLTYNGQMFLSEYDSFKGTCSGGTCSGTYTKLPTGQTHTVSFPSSFARGAGGHGRGMSQIAANYMASQGKSYQEILSFFYASGTDASVHPDYLQGSSNYPTETYAQFDGATYVSWARRYIGNPYVWGGTDLVNGADCSGFTQTLAKTLFNISLPRTAAQQAGVGMVVNSLAEAKPGDLLFYSKDWTTANIGHVAIYAGGDMQVHAANSRVGIVESKINETPFAIRRLGG